MVIQVSTFSENCPQKGGKGGKGGKGVFPPPVLTVHDFPRNTPPLPPFPPFFQQVSKNAVGFYRQRTKIHTETATDISTLLMPSQPQKST